MKWTYRERALKAHHPKVKALFEIMEDKKSNLALSADVETKKELLELADLIGPKICLLKTHIDIVEDFDLELIDALKALSEKHHFLIFEDRKFADIGHTVSLQFAKGIYKIASWADFINAHPIVGPGIIQGLEKVHQGQALILLAQMSSKGNLMNQNYLNQVIALAKARNPFVGGFISMEQLVQDPALIHMTPGVQLDTHQDTLGQQYQTPEKALIENGTDLIIVGRGIYQDPNPLLKAEVYRQAGWEAHLKRINPSSSI